MEPPVTAPIVRVLTNTTWFDGRRFEGASIRTRRSSATGLLAIVREFFTTRRYDVALFDDAATRQLLVFSLARKLVRVNRCKLVSVDLILQQPKTFLERLRARLVRHVLETVDLFIFYHKDIRGLERVYGIRLDRAAYIPFKVNDYASVLATPTRDEGFILSCGRSYRDYRTFCEALKGLPYEARILATVEQTAEHGTTFDFASVPPNVRVVTDDGSWRSWIDSIARATFVVLPILPNALSPAGLSTYLVAMALGKCVIITDSPGTRGILEDGQAVVVPAADAHALRAAIVKVSEDADYRQRMASVGRTFALSLGDERRLADDMVRTVLQRLSAERLNGAAGDRSP